MRFYSVKAILICYFYFNDDEDAVFYTFVGSKILRIPSYDIRIRFFWMVCNMKVEWPPSTFTNGNINVKRFQNVNFIES